MRFKPGDILKCVESRDTQLLSEGLLYVAVEYNTLGNVVVTNIKGELMNNGRGFYPFRFILDETAKVKHIMKQYGS